MINETLINSACGVFFAFVVIVVVANIIEKIQEKLCPRREKKSLYRITLHLKSGQKLHLDYSEFDHYWDSSEQLKKHARDGFSAIFEYRGPKNRGNEKYIIDTAKIQVIEFVGSIYE